MTFASRETSVYGAFPIELYTIARDAVVYRYTSADEDKVVNGFVYQSVPIKRGSTSQTDDAVRSNLSITATKNLAFLNTYRSSPPTTITTVTVQRYHEGDGALAVIWFGRLTNVRFSERDAVITCEPVLTSLKRPVLRRRYQVTCPFVLYGNQCRAIRSDFGVATMTSFVNGGQIQAQAFGLFPDGYFEGGYIEWDNGGDVQRRFILSHFGQILTLNLPFAGITGNVPVTAYPGCDHELLTCYGKFNNHLNYGGQPFNPRKNPMGKIPVF